MAQGLWPKSHASGMQVSELVLSWGRAETVLTSISNCVVRALCRPIGQALCGRFGDQRPNRLRTFMFVERLFRQICLALHTGMSRKGRFLNVLRPIARRNFCYTERYIHAPRAPQHVFHTPLSQNTTFYIKPRAPKLDFLTPHVSEYTTFCIKP